MTAEQVTELYLRLQNQGVRLWIDGGWGIDALLHRQTRAHKDLDALIHWDDLTALTQILAADGFRLKEIWSENRWAVYSASLPFIAGDFREEMPTVATAFVLNDQAGRELDIHVLRFDERGNGIPVWHSDAVYPVEALQIYGSIDGVSVRCLSAPMQMKTHCGYLLQAKDLQDLRHLHERFGLDYPPEIAHHFR